MMRPGPVAAILLLVASVGIPAGCLEIAGTQGTSAAEKTNQSWAGSWATKVKGGDTDTPMDLVQSGLIVTGSYGYGDGTLVGIIRDDRLTGTWTEDNGQSTGQFEFVLAKNGLTFTGWWAYPDDNFDDIRAGPPIWRGWRA